MRRFSIFRFVGVFVVAVLLLASASFGSVRNTIASQEPGDPYAAWVPADMLIADDGSIQWHLMDKTAQWQLRGYLKEIKRLKRESKKSKTSIPLSEGGCAIVASELISDSYNPRPRGTLTELVEYSPGAYLGHVVDVAEGFFLGNLGSLLHVIVERSYKGSGPEEPRELYVFVQSAEIMLRGLRLCKPGRRPAPQVDSRLLVFYGRSVSGVPAESLLVPSDFELFTELPDGKASLPELMELQLGADALPTFSELIRRTEDLLANEVPDEEMDQTPSIDQIKVRKSNGVSNSQVDSAGVVGGLDATLGN